jgi:hypothetical protein
MHVEDFDADSVQVELLPQSRRSGAVTPKGEILQKKGPVKAIPLHNAKNHNQKEHRKNTD